MSIFTDARDRVPDFRRCSKMCDASYDISVCLYSLTRVIFVVVGFEFTDARKRVIFFFFFLSQKIIDHFF